MGGIIKKAAKVVAKPVKEIAEELPGGGVISDAVSEVTGGSSSPAPQQAAPTETAAPDMAAGTEQRGESVDQPGPAAAIEQDMGPDFAERSRRLREGLLRGESLFSRLGSSQRNRGTRQTLG